MVGIRDDVMQNMTGLASFLYPFNSRGSESCEVFLNILPLALVEYAILAFHVS
jgi:hypothetical protein